MCTISRFQTKILAKIIEPSGTVLLARNFSLSSRVNDLRKLELDHYEEDGFFVVRKLVSDEKLDNYVRRFREICNKNVKAPGMTIMRDVSLAKNSEFKQDENTVTKIQDFCYDDTLFEFCCLPEILQYVKPFCGENIMAMHTMLINKPPDSGALTSRHPLHQDLYYFPFRPADKIICAWTAIEDVHRRNGCLTVVPGSHKGKLLEHDYPRWEGGVNKMYYAIKDFDLEKLRLIYLEMSKGDTVFFHPLLVHGSGANVTNGFRKAISCHFAASECHYVDVVGTVQERFKQEVEKYAAKKFDLSKDKQIDLNDIWRMKSRLVAGKRIHL